MDVSVLHAGLRVLAGVRAAAAGGLRSTIDELVQIWLAHHNLNLLSQFWIHNGYAELIGWPLNHVLNTPSHHRVHHSRNAYAIDKNYGHVLIIWDRLFGSFAEERTSDDEEKLAFGLVEPVTLDDDQLHYQTGKIKSALWDRPRQMKTAWAVYMPPGWTPTAGAKRWLCWWSSTDEKIEGRSALAESRAEEPTASSTTWAMRLYVFFHCTALNFFLILCVGRMADCVSKPARSTSLFQFSSSRAVWLLVAFHIGSIQIAELLLRFA